MAHLNIAPDLGEEIPVLALGGAREEEVVSSALVLLTLGTHVRVELLRLFARDSNTCCVEPILTTITSHVKPFTGQERYSDELNENYKNQLASLVFILFVVVRFSTDTVEFLVGRLFSFLAIVTNERIDLLRLALANANATAVKPVGTQVAAHVKPTNASRGW